MVICINKIEKFDKRNNILKFKTNNKLWFWLRDKLQVILLTSLRIIIKYILHVDIIFDSIHRIHWVCKSNTHSCVGQQQPSMLKLPIEMAVIHLNNNEKNFKFYLWIRANKKGQGYHQL